MRKRLVKQGHNTLTVAIPAKWVRENKLSPGDELELNEHDNSLMLSLAAIPKEETISIDIRKLYKTTINWILAAAYKRGYDKVIVTYRDNGQLKTISERIKECLKNYEIVEQTNSSITIKAISTAQDEDFSTLLRRIFLVNLSFFRSVLEALENKKYNELLDSVYLEETNDSLVNTCQRIIVKNKKLSQKDIFFIYVIIWQLEKIADALKHFCQDSRSKNITKELVDKFRQVASLYEDFYNLYYRFNQEKLDNIIKAKRALLSKFDDREDIYLRMLTEQILDLSGSYLALKLVSLESQNIVV